MFIRPFTSIPNLLLTFVIFGVESIARFIVTLTPKFIIIAIDSVIQLQVYKH